MTSLTYLGTERSVAFFRSRDKLVSVNTKSLTASLLSLADNPHLLDVAENASSTSPSDPVWEEIALASLRASASPSTLQLSSSMKRMFSVPKNVALAAKTALGAENILPPASTYVARTLSSSGQISCSDVLWMSRFFSSHLQSSTDKSLWDAWGGDSGRLWSEALSSRVNYDSVTADAGMYDTPGVQDFVDGDESDRTFWAMLVEPLGRHANSLYKLTSAGTWQAWGNGDWIECDSPTPSPEFVELDDEAALYLAGALFDAPDTPIDLRTPNPEAWDIAEAARDEIDWDLVDRAVQPSYYTAEDLRSFVSAGGPVEDAYSPEERSKNASSQLRDANGRFATVGASGAIKSSGIGGTITQADAASAIVTVAGDDGNSYEVPASDFEVGAAPHPKVDPAAAKESGIDLTGIVAPPREVPLPRAKLGYEPSVLSPIQISDTIDLYSEHVNSERQERSKQFKEIVGHSESSELASISTDNVPNPTPDPTPDTTDVDPIYFAVVAKDDPQAVMELVALVPSSAVSNDPKTFRRAGGKWVEDVEILRDIRSATPPPIIQLDADQFEDVLAQVDLSGTDVATPTDDDTQQTITAAGGADRNRGGAEKLRHYWTVGPGGMKIRWNTGGDWTRCVRLLSKHLGPRAKGYCALRHKEMTGMWPGDKKNRGMSNSISTPSGAYLSPTEYLRTSEEVVTASAHAAALEVAQLRVRGGEYSPIPPTVEAINEGRSGRAFTIPLVIPEGLATGDGRVFGKGSLGMRTLPLPLLWQIQTGEGHDGSVLVGQILRVDRIKNGLGNAYGVFDTGPYGKEAQRLVESGMLRWISADLDKFEVDENKSDNASGKMHIKKGRLMGATLVPKPAFQECIIELVPLQENEMPLDATSSGITASASIAASIPVEPPSLWFDRPILNGPTPITVTNDGQVFGHIATWTQDHIGLQSVRAPRSASNYAYFHTGVLRTHEGKDVKVGQLTLAGGHAPLHVDASSAVRHYDDTASAIADVHAGEDSYGIYVAGALRPGVTPEQIRALRASAPSGDWRSINHRLELVAICQVNVPGFPVPRSLAASGALTSLVAAGMAPLLEMRAAEIHEGNEALAASASARIDALFNVPGYLSTPENMSKDERQELFANGEVLSDGSFPVRDVGDLKRAVRAYSHVSPYKQASVRRHIVKRARALSRTDLVPVSWRELGLSDRAIDHRTRYEAMMSDSNARKVAALRAQIRSSADGELAARVAALRGRLQK